LWGLLPFKKGTSTDVPWGNQESLGEGKVVEKLKTNNAINSSGEI